MGSRVLKFENYAQTSTFPENAFASRADVRALAAAESPAVENEGLRCAKGCLIGIGIEAMAGLALYGLWELWHLFR